MLAVTKRNVNFEEKISQALEENGLGGIERISRIQAGEWADVFRVLTSKGRTLASKVGHPGHEGVTKNEALMLRYLKDETRSPFPDVLGERAGVLILEYLQNDGRVEPHGTEETGRALALLHNARSGDYGFDFDTTFGPCPQPNTKTTDWSDFFGRHRLMYMGELALKAGQVNRKTFDSLCGLVRNLRDLLPTKPRPALLHGDLWRGNVLYHRGRLSGFLDPAIYVGDQEVDLSSFPTLFDPPPEEFLKAYGQIRPIEPGFQERKEIYRLWGLLFHAYWGGGRFGAHVARVLGQFGY